MYRYVCVHVEVQGKTRYLWMLEWGFSDKVKDWTLEHVLAYVQKLEESEKPWELGLSPEAFGEERIGGHGFAQMVGGSVDEVLNSWGQKLSKNDAYHLLQCVTYVTHYFKKSWTN